jgi:2-keto-4-pentenoate hydratase/2-oxohepta-3-ene-1,7-dioic acid hydratase in catechol pathway
MRLCRFQYEGQTAAGFYDEQGIVPIAAAADEYRKQSGQSLDIPAGDDLLALLPPDGTVHREVARLAAWTESHRETVFTGSGLPLAAVKLLVPIPRPNKMFFLAGNYAQHIEEGGGIAAERAETFPYVFMKPPSTTLTDPGQPVRIPSLSPEHIDWELELAVVIGRLAKGVPESEALDYVAGYTVVNDISDRRFRPNANRKTRDRDRFFDWLHGKWHDSFCPCGPCILSADAVGDPQQFELRLSVNGDVKQHASTALQIFPVAAVIEFIASFVTLEPGDIIATGTPAGVGDARGEYLKSGDRIEASIASIGTLVSVVESAASAEGVGSRFRVSRSQCG